MNFNIENLSEAEITHEATLSTQTYNIDLFLLIIPPTYIT
jgi:hypothetical protein